MIRELSLDDFLERVTSSRNIAFLQDTGSLDLTDYLGEGWKVRVTLECPANVSTQVDPIHMMNGEVYDAKGQEVCSVRRRYEPQTKTIQYSTYYTHQPPRTRAL